MITKLQYYVSRETDPYINLATETYLLDTVDENTLVLYLWQNKNTVVIGRNQNPWAECRCAALQEDGGVVARRLSGGGAVFHDLGNVNFTFLCTEDNEDIGRNMRIIQRACAMEGIAAEVSGRNDITVNGRKFSGNAFRYVKGKCLHHGTILVNADTEKLGKYLTPPKAKLQSKGVKSVGARVVNLSELSPTVTCAGMMQHLQTAFAETLGLPLERMETIDTERVATLAAQYGTWEYIYGKTIDFSASIEGRFAWGQVQLLLKIEDGTIVNAQTFTDALDGDLAENIATALVGCRYECPTVTARLATTLTGEVLADLTALFEEQGF